MQTINLDISRMKVIPTLYAKQTDVGRKFKAILTDGGVAYAVPAGAAVSIWYSGASGEGNYTDVGADSAISASGNEITVELITQMLSNPGSGVLCLVINAPNGDQIGTWNIPYLVEKIPGVGSLAAQEYFTAFSKAVQNLSYPDASLSLAGKAADAAAVGVALATKAPAGYVDSFVECKTDEDIEKAINDEWSAMSDRSVRHIVMGVMDNSMVLPSCYWLISLYRALEDFGTLTAVSYSESGPWTLQRNRFRGVWTPWEWVNPPMMTGVKYRTTERHNGKSVYAKLVYAGYLPNNDDTSIVVFEHNIDPDIDTPTALRRVGSLVDIKPILRYVDGYYAEHENLQYFLSTDGADNWSESVVEISTTANLSGWEGWFLVKWTEE